MFSKRHFILVTEGIPDFNCLTRLLWYTIRANLHQIQLVGTVKFRQKDSEMPSHSIFLFALAISTVSDDFLFGIFGLQIAYISTWFCILNINMVKCLLIYGIYSKHLNPILRLSFSLSMACSNFYFLTCPTSVRKNGNDVILIDIIRSCYFY